MVLARADGLCHASDLACAEGVDVSCFKASDMDAEKGEGDADVQQEDRLSTAPPSICEEQVVEEVEDVEQDAAEPNLAEKVVARLPAQAAKPRWADLCADSDEEREAFRPASVVGRAAVANPQQDEEESKGSGKGGAAAASSCIRHDDRKSVSAGNSKAGAKGNGKGRCKANSEGPAEGYYKSAAKGKGKDSAKVNSEDPTTGKGKDFIKGKGKGGAKGNDATTGKGKDSIKGKGKGGAKGKGKAGTKDGGSKCQCQFYIGIKEEPKFRVCRRLLGPQGQYMKDIAEQTGGRLRLRGRGSKFLEGPQQQESGDPLMLCLSAPDACGYSEAKRLVSDLLEGIYQEFKEFQVSQGSVPKVVKLHIHEGPRESSQ